MATIHALTTTRPPVTSNGWKVHVSTHDEWHLAEKARLRRALILSHPDHGGTFEALYGARDRLKAFELAEAAWYHGHGVPPPSRLPPHDPMPTLDDIEHRVFAFVCGGGVSSTIPELAEKTGITKSQARDSTARLRHKKLVNETGCRGRHSRTIFIPTEYGFRVWDTLREAR